ncbi:MAG TPA: acyltransferase [Acidimicrobiales bacterium]|nr:acyltransferase [Acidimicrobiales bacterium]
MADRPAQRPRFRLGHRPALDGLRGVAIVIVVIYHMGVVLTPEADSWLLLPGGFLGVDLFFALSGFLITTLLLGELGDTGRIDMLGFARRRGRRLVPALAGLLVVAAIVAATTEMYVLHEVAITSVWSLTFTVNWAVPHNVPVAIGHLWSLAIEVQFYLLWSAVMTVVALLVPVRRIRAVLAVIALAGIAAVALNRALAIGRGENFFFLYLGTFDRLDAPLVGALAGLAVGSGWVSRMSRRTATLLSLLGLSGLLAGAMVLRYSDAVLYEGLFTVLAVCAALTVLGAVAHDGTWLARVLGSPPLVGVGAWSYSLYLWHLPVFEALARWTPGYLGSFRAAMGLVTSGVIAWLSYQCVERPFLSRRRSASGAVRDRGPVGSATG